MRRWSVTIQFERSFDVEAFFHEDGTFRDTARFRDEVVPWRFVYGLNGEVSVQIVVERPSLAPFRVRRTADDWGWQLVSTGSFANMAIFTSRQLGPDAHEVASRVSPEIVTLYMVWSGCIETGGDDCTGIYGAWICFGAFQGTMPANSWKGAHIVSAPGMLTITMSDNFQVLHRCAVDEAECTIDVFHTDGADEEISERLSWRGVYQLDMDRQVLIACRNERWGGPRPSGPPEGLPSVDEALLDLEHM